MGLCARCGAEGCGENMTGDVEKERRKERRKEQDFRKSERT